MKALLRYMCYGALALGLISVFYQFGAAVYKMFCELSFMSALGMTTLAIVVLILVIILGLLALFIIEGVFGSEDSFNKQMVKYLNEIFKT